MDECIISMNIGDMDLSLNTSVLLNEEDARLLDEQTSTDGSKFGVCDKTNPECTNYNMIVREDRSRETLPRTGGNCEYSSHLTCSGNGTSQAAGTCLCQPYIDPRVIRRDQGVALPFEHDAGSNDVSPGHGQCSHTCRLKDPNASYLNPTGDLDGDGNAECSHNHPKNSTECEGNPECEWVPVFDSPKTISHPSCMTPVTHELMAGGPYTQENCVGVWGTHLGPLTLPEAQFVDWTLTDPPNRSPTCASETTVPAAITDTWVKGDGWGPIAPSYSVRGYLGAWEIGESIGIQSPYRSPACMNANEQALMSNKRETDIANGVRYGYNLCGGDVTVQPYCDPASQ